MATKRYEMSAWDRMRLMRDKAEQIKFSIEAIRLQEQLPVLTEMVGGMLGEMCQLHIELRELAAGMKSAAEKSAALEAPSLANAKRN